LSNKINLISNLLNSLNIHVFICTEHWQTATNLKIIELKNFKLASHYCRSTFIHGGTCIYVRKDINYIDIPVKEICTDKEFESCAINIQFKEIDVIISSIYRSPDGDVTNFIEKLDAMLHKISQLDLKKHLLIAGDFNFDFLKKDKNVLACIDCFDSFNLLPLVHEITRECKVTKAKTCIDNVFTDTEIKRCIVKDYQISDNKAIVLSILADTFTNYNVTSKRTNITQCNINQVKNRLSQLKFDNSNNHGENCISYINNIVKIFDFYFPLSYKKKQAQVKSVCNKDIEIKNQKYIVAIYFDASKDFPEDIVKYNNYLIQKQRLKNLIDSKEKDKNGQKILAADNPSKEIWNIVRENTNYKDTEEKLITEIATTPDLINTTSNPNKIANILNKHFINVPRNIHGKIGPLINEYPFEYIRKPARCVPTFYLTPVTIEEVIKLFNRMSNSGALDNQQLSPKFIKQFATEIAPSYTDYINYCFQNSIFPDSLKISKVIPLFKKGNHLDPNNYRPIAILPVWSKIFERALHDRLMTFFRKYNILNNAGFINPNLTGVSI